MNLSGRNYYIDTAGNDNLDGLTPNTALRTFHAVNKTRLQPGDKVLLKCGCVWNEQLIINGRGTEDRFIEVSSYGKGNLPKIQRNGEIADRCVRANDASFLKIGNLEVCGGGAGIVLYYDNCYHNRSVYLENILAHDFVGIYRASGESSQKEAWKSYRSDDRVGFSMGICVTGRDTTPFNNERVLTDLRVTNCEIYHTGAGIGLDWCDHKCCDGTEVGKNKFGDVLFEGLYLHDNTVPDVSLTSIFLQCATNAIFRNSVIDAGAGGAPWGTAAVHLQLCKNVCIQNVTIKNMPHTDVSDECGIDLEADVEDCLIVGCRFENNAGAAIEFLANSDVSGQAVSRNIWILDSVFINNNWAKRYANPSQILVQNWHEGNKPAGRVWNCVYRNPEGIAFVGGDGNLSELMLMNNREWEENEAVRIAYPDNRVTLAAANG